MMRFRNIVVILILFSKEESGILICGNSFLNHWVDTLQTTRQSVSVCQAFHITNIDIMGCQI
jgi:hypothetical protein